VRSGSTSNVDPHALGSDVARTQRQLWVRRVARGVAKGLGLNSPNAFSTELVQSLDPVARIDTAHGPLFCRAGHGRLVWRAETFFSEEPDTIRWLDEMEADDIFWDVGANVGLYSLYAALFRKCRTYAFEPEAQNYALLMQNVALNGAPQNLVPSCIAVSDSSGFGRLNIRYITKGGAYNLFQTGADPSGPPPSIEAAHLGRQAAALAQFTYGASIDDLVFVHNLPAPSCLKIDVDGLEPKIIAGCQRTLELPGLRSLLVEINKNSEEDRRIVDTLRQAGFRIVRETSSWINKPDLVRETALPCFNVIFART
jgi:FkbM family methyltransferase